MRPLRFALLASTITLSASAADELRQNGRVRVAFGDWTSAARYGRRSVESGTDLVGAAYHENRWRRGKLAAGLTNEIARNGKQSFFVDFQQLTAPSQWVSISTLPVAVKPRQTYRVSIWGASMARARWRSMNADPTSGSICSFSRLIARRRLLMPSSPSR